MGLAKQVGQRVRQIRTDQSMAQSQLASAAGVSKSFISQVERGVKTPGMRSLTAIAKALGVLPGDLMPAPGADGVGDVAGVPA